MALPADLNVNERILWFLTWQQMAYVAVGLVVGIAVGSWAPLAGSQRSLAILATIGIFTAAALFRPADRGLVGWISVLVTFLRDTHAFVWQQTTDVVAIWGVGRAAGAASALPTARTRRPGGRPRGHDV